MFDFINSQFFSTLVTLAVGFSAFFIYRKQKDDKKRDAAKLILQEIRYAESQVRTYRTTGGYSFAGKLLPTNNWNKNIHLFINDLKETEIDLISNFYSSAAYIDTVVNMISNIVNNSVISGGSTNNTEKPNEPPKKIVLGSQATLTDVSNKIEFVYNTPAAAKLMELAGLK